MVLHAGRSPRLVFEAVCAIGSIRSLPRVQWIRTLRLQRPRGTKGGPRRLPLLHPQRTTSVTALSATAVDFAGVKRDARNFSLLFDHL